MVSAPRISRVEKSLNLLFFSISVDLLGKEFRFIFNSPYNERELGVGASGTRSDVPSSTGRGEQRENVPCML